MADDPTETRDDRFPALPVEIDSTRPAVAPCPRKFVWGNWVRSQLTRPATLILALLASLPAAAQPEQVVVSVQSRSQHEVTIVWQAAALSAGSEYPAPWCAVAWSAAGE